jgi:glycosyltransferase involved in cell wall biosynthesis
MTATPQPLLGVQTSICFYSPYSGRGNTSGTRVRLEMLARHLSARGIDVHIVGPFDKIEGATIHYMSLDVPLPLRPFLSLKARRMIAALKPKAVVLEGPAFVFGLRAGKVVQMIHDGKFATRHRRRGGRFLWFYYFLVCRLCDFTLTVSAAERDRIAASLRLKPERLLVSYNGIDDIWLTRPKATGPKQFDLLYVSNFARHKGHLRLLACLRDKGLRIALVGGDLGTKAETRTYAEAEGLDVTFFSNLSTEALIDLYDTAKVFAFPSELEGFGIPFLEARARGLPVVASNLTVFHELAANLGGKIVDFDAREAAAASIFEALDQPTTRPELAGFRWSDIADRLSIQIL